MENREKWLKENGFKRKWFSDKSGDWWVKPVKIGEFKGYFYYDEIFCYLYVNSFDHYYGNKYQKNNAIIWKGSWNQFKTKVKKYGRSI